MTISSRVTAGVFVGLLLQSNAHAGWQPPVGIPVPEFGIEESHHQYDGLDGYRDAGNGPYSLYVDNNSEQCDDNGPGTRATPLCDIPSSIETPGTVIEVHGGPYDYNDEKQRLMANGTREQPIFIRGVDDGNGLPILDNASTYTMQGSYFIVENLVFTRTSVRTGSPNTPNSSRHHIALRHLEIARHPDKNASALAGSDIVFYKNHVHHNFGDDRHGTTVARGSERVWIVDNYFHHNGGDAVQFCHRCRKDAPRNVYVGRNLMHSDRENAVDLKFGKGIVISENTMYGYRRARPDTEWCFDDDSYCGKFSSGSDGSAIVIGSDGAPKNPWILYNNIYDSEQGIRVEEVKSAWLIGNTIHDIDNRAIALQKDGDPLHIIGNTIDGAKIGIDQYWRHNFALNVDSNVFANIEDKSVEVGGRVASQSTIVNNVFWNGDKKVRLHWGKNASGKDGAIAIRGGEDNIVANPGIRAVSDNVIEATAGALALPATIEKIAAHDAEFREIFGNELSIKPRCAAGKPVDN